jgi:hypothetical protein
MAVLWVVVPCSLVEVYQHFITLMMEARSTSETVVIFYQTTWYNNPEDSYIRYSLLWEPQISLTWCIYLNTTCTTIFRKTKDIWFHITLHYITHNKHYCSSYHSLSALTQHENMTKELGKLSNTLLSHETVKFGLWYYICRFVVLKQHWKLLTTNTLLPTKITGFQQMLCFR